MLFKRLLSVFLCTALFVCLFSSLGYASADVMNADAVFDAIDAAIGAAPSLRSVMTDAEKTKIAKNTVNRLGYRTTDRGDGCFIFTVNGEPCIFNCRMYDIFSKMTPLEGYVDDGQVVTVDYSARSTGPDSKDVYLIEPFYGTDSSFTRQYQNEASSIAKETGGTYTLYKTSKATIDAVADALESGGVVIFDSHGDTDYYETPDRGDYVSEANTSYLLLSTGTGLTSSDKSSATGAFGTYYHAMSSNGYYYVDGTAITNHMEKSAPNNLVWMAICLGMATEGMEKPLREHGVGVVYGYSQSVTFDGDYDYEETFWDNMKDGEDVKTAVAAMKSKHGNWDPGMSCSSISSARREYAAFPIVVSDLDTYPGHGNVDDYQTVNSDWTLFGGSPSFQIQAASANEAYGTVSVSGQTVTAYPKDGYVVEGCTVTPENACTVTREGNTFLLSDIVADCTVTVSFCARTPVTVTYCVPDGMSCESTCGYAGDTAVLSAPAGQPSADRYAYTFLGWSETQVPSASEQPEYYPAGTKLTLTNDLVLYALFSYDLCSSEVSQGFPKLAEQKEDYSGSYVIGCDDEAFLNASGDVTGTAIGGKKGVVLLEDSGMVYAGERLFLAPDSLIFELSLADEKADTYTIRMKNSENYLLHTLIGNSLTTTDDPSKDGAQWKIIFDEDTVLVKNASTQKYLQYNAESSLFRCYPADSYAPVTLYSAGTSGILFTTQPEAACSHIWGEPETFIAPTCTCIGVEKYCCSLCGKETVEPVTELGHDFVDGVCTRCDAIDPDYEPPCSHENTELRNATDVTCLEPGYTGDLYCIDCGELLTEGCSITALGHDFVDGVCTRCDAEDPDYEPPVDPCEGYTDIDRNGWYHTYADFVIEKGLMGSTTSGLTFEPNTPCTRSMIVTILYSLANKPAVKYEDKFPDVKDGQWYTDPVMWAYQNGIVNGYNTGYFGTDDNITREQLAVIFKAYAEKIEERDTSARAELADFADSNKITWSKDAVAWAVAAGLISGKPGGNGTTILDPQGKASRAEVAVILMKYLSE